jgi:hypothetical protein
VNNFCKDGSDHILVRDTALMTTSQIADTVSLGFFKSSALISPSAAIWWDAFGAGVKLNVGDAANPTGLANQIDVSAAGTAALWKGFTAAKMGQPLWQALGYGADPGGTIELLGTIASANGGANVNVAWQIFGINR